MGIVFKPEDLSKRFVKRELLEKEVKGLPLYYNLEAIISEIENLKREIQRIKETLRKHGIEIK